MNNEASELKNKPESKNLCKRGCGFYGSVQFKDMCSKCYQEQVKCDATIQQSSLVCPSSIDLSEPRASQYLTCESSSSSSSSSSTSVSATNITNSPTGITMRTGSCSTTETPLRSLKRKAESPIPTAVEIKESETSRPVSRVNRCAWCRKRVGLTGFLCRCDGLFCSLHRYSDQHECSYDYQANGRLELARANPEIRCPKVRKL